MKQGNTLEDAISSLFKDYGQGYGLDFGTFRSQMAYKNANDNMATITTYDNPLNRNGIPCLFWYSAEKQKEFVCHEVLSLNGHLNDPKGICSSIKMKLEENYIFLNGKRYTPSYIAEQIIRKVLLISHYSIKKQLSAEPTYKKLVVGVPVRFGTIKRQLLKKVLIKATDNKEIVLLPEPIAAAITYAKLFPLSNNILIFDLGAGSFDTVLLEINKHRTKENPYMYTPKHPDGLEIAGNYFDQKVQEIIIEKLMLNPGLIDLSKITNNQHPDYLRLKEDARKAKELLSTEEQVTLSIKGTSATGGSCLQKVSISRTEFENAINPAVTEIVNCAYNVLERANLHHSKNVSIFLVGGSTYIPFVKDMIRSKFKYIDEKKIVQVYPEHAIAMGCAIFANEEVCHTPIAYAYAIGTHLQLSNKDVLDVIIPSYATTPIKKQLTYYTRYPNQNSITLDFFELDYGEPDATLDIDVGNPMHIHARHYFGKKVPARTPVDVTIELSKDGILTASFDDRGISNIDKQTVSIADI